MIDTMLEFLAIPSVAAYFILLLVLLAIALWMLLAAFLGSAE